MDNYGRPWITVFLLFFIITYLYYRPITVPCVACSKPSWWYKCADLNLSGEIERDIQKVCSNYECIKKCGLRETINIYDLIRDTGIFGILWNELKEIPQDVLKLLKTVEIETKHLLESFIKILEPFYEKVKNGLKELLEKGRKVVINTWNDFLNYIILPIVTFFVENVYKPIIPMIQTLILLKNKLRESIITAWEKLQNFPLNEMIEKIKKALAVIGNAFNELGSVLIGAINAVKNNLISGLNKGLSEGTQITQDTVNDMLSFAEITSNDFLKSLNQSIDSSEQIVRDIGNFANNIAFDITKGINMALSDTVAGFNKGINGVNNGLMDVTNEFSKVKTDIENGVNQGINDINIAMNTVTTAFNDVGNGIQTGLNDIVGGLNDFGNGWNQFTNTDIKIGIPPIKLGDLGTLNLGTQNIQPFNFLPKANPINSPNVCPNGKCNYNAQIKPITIENFEFIPPIKTPQIPPFDRLDVRFPPSNIPKSVSIPPKKLNSPMIPNPPDLSPNDFKINFNPFEPIEEVYNDSKEYLIDILNTIEQPIYNFMKELLKISTFIIGVIKEFFVKYVNWKYIRSQFEIVLKRTETSFDEMIEFAKLKVFTPTLIFFEEVKVVGIELVKEFSKELYEKLKPFLKIITTIFIEILSITRKYMKTGLKIAGATALTSFSVWLDISTPWWSAEPVTKMTIAILIIAYILLAPFVTSGIKLGYGVKYVGEDIYTAIVKIPFEYRILLFVSFIILIVYMKMKEKSVECDCDNLLNFKG